MRKIVTPKQHLVSIMRFWRRLGEKKYMAGQKEHGGQLRYKRGMLSHCEEETWDLCAYLPTLRAQLEDVRGLLRKAFAESPRPEVVAAHELLDQILGPAVNKHLEGR